MGDAECGPIRLSFNPQLHVEFRGAGIGYVRGPDAHARDRPPRQGANVDYPPGHGLRVCPELPLNDAYIRHRVKTVHARTALTDEVPATIIGEGDVQGLVDVTDPVTEILVSDASLA